MLRLKNFWEKYQTYLLAFLLPAFIMLCYFVFRGFYPFGTSSLLTVDLGQQYVDFFEFFRQSLLHHPTNFIYSFSKALGGQMMGEWAYYLLSPFNLLLLPFSKTSLTTGILLVTVLKYGCAGLSFAYLLKKQNFNHSGLIPALSVAYAMMGFMVANQLNLLWLDAVIILPLVILYLCALLDGKKWLPYLLWLAAILAINYYMGYMIALFSIIFSLWYATCHFTTFSQWLSAIKRYVLATLGAGLLAGIILLPTYVSLLASKAQYSESSVSFKFEYSPYKMLSKLFIGSFNFNQMPSGYPNLYVSCAVLVLVIWYFFNHAIALKERLASFIVLVFLGLSMCFAPLDLLWHAGQFPVWYPYRFSYIVSFWLLWLAVRCLHVGLAQVATWVEFLSLAAILVLFITFFQLQTKFDYLTHETLIITLGLMIASLICIAWLKLAPDNSLVAVALGTLIIADMSLNMVYSLNNISYLSQKEWATPATVLAQNTAQLKKLDGSFYRVAQLYSRTKNDALANGFNSGSYFSSALEKQMPTFYAMMGQTDGDNNVGYTNGTQITDSLLDMKYYLAAKDTADIAKNAPNPSLATWSERPDVLNSSKKVASNNWTNIYQNNLASGIAYLTSSKLLRLKSITDDPVTYQTNWLNAILGTNYKYFTAQNFDQVVFGNVKQQTTLTNQVFYKQNLAKDGTIVFKFTPTTNNTYYLSLGSSLTSDNATFYIGNRQLNQVSTWRHTELVAVASHQKGQEVIITVKLKKSSIWLANFVLYEMNDKLVNQQLKKVQQQSMTTTSYSSRRINGTITTTKNNQWLTTTIPYSSGWKAYVDGKQVKTYAVNGKTFVAIKIAKAGKHTIIFKFTPPGIWLGVLASTISIVGMGATGYYLRRKRKASK